MLSPSRDTLVNRASTTDAGDDQDRAEKLQELLTGFGSAPLPGMPVVTVPLFKQDVQGLKKLRAFQSALFDDANLLL